ncbi:MAG: hypothetical protein ACRDAU_15835 [Clostridium sp.]
MGRRGQKGPYGNFNKNFMNMKRNLGNKACFRWFTPGRCCICGGIFTTLLFSGASFYGIIIVALLITIMQLID